MTSDTTSMWPEDYTPRDITFTEWITRQRRLQVEVFDNDVTTMSGEELADYIRFNVLALVDEAMEALRETRWKPWDRADKRGEVNRENLKKELVDILHFIGNIAAVGDISGAELAEEYLRKVEENTQRAQNGYDAGVPKT